MNSLAIVEIVSIIIVGEFFALIFFSFVGVVVHFHSGFNQIRYDSISIGRDNMFGLAFSNGIEKKRRNGEAKKTSLVKMLGEKKSGANIYCTVKIRLRKIS